MAELDPFVVGADPQGLPVGQPLRLANRHGLIAGATGTGKTVTLQRLIETFSDAGVAVFAADILSDVPGLSLSRNGAFGGVTTVRMRGAAIRPLSSLLIDSGWAWTVSTRTLASGADASGVEALSQPLSSRTLTNAAR